MVRLDVYLLLHLLLLHLRRLTIEPPRRSQSNPFADLIGIGPHECNTAIGVFVGEVSDCHFAFHLSAMHNRQSLLADVIDNREAVACRSIEDGLEGGEVQHIKTAETRQDETAMAGLQILNLEGEGESAIYRVILVVPDFKYACPFLPISAHQGNIGCEGDEHSRVSMNLSFPIDGLTG